MHFDPYLGCIRPVFVFMNTRYIAGHGSFKLFAIRVIVKYHAEHRTCDIYCTYIYIFFFPKNLFSTSSTTFIARVFLTTYVLFASSGVYIYICVYPHEIVVPSRDHYIGTSYTCTKYNEKKNNDHRVILS